MDGGDSAAGLFSHLRPDTSTPTYTVLLIGSTADVGAVVFASFRRCTFRDPEKIIEMAKRRSGLKMR